MQPTETKTYMAIYERDPYDGGWTVRVHGVDDARVHGPTLHRAMADVRAVLARRLAIDEALVRVEDRMPERISPILKRANRARREADRARARAQQEVATAARELADLDGFSLLCGRYEGVDERVRQHLVDGELSVGDYVLAGGEVAAMVVLEAVGRLVPGVMGNDTSADDESFADGLLEYPHYTRPAELRGWEVPEVLRSGDHARVTRWRRAHALARTRDHRPDLLEARGGLTPADEALLSEFDL